MNSPKDPLDEILLSIFTTNIEHDGSYIPVSAIRAKVPEAKQQILTHYISYEELEKLIGEDTPAPTDPRIESGANWNRREANNQLKAELKAALKKRRESK